MINHQSCDLSYIVIETFTKVSEINASLVCIVASFRKIQDESVKNPGTSSAHPGITSDSSRRTQFPSHA